MEWTLFLDNLNALNEWIDDIDDTDCILVNLVQKYQDPTRAPGLLRTKKGHVWINHAYILQQIPFLKISIVTLRKRLKHLVDVGILGHEIVYPQTDSGVRKNACYRVSKAFIEMCEYYKTIQSVHSDKKLGEEDKQGKLAFLLKEKPEVSRKVMRYHTGKVRERDGKGRYRMVTDDHTSWSLTTIRNGRSRPLIPPLDPSSRNSASNNVQPPPESAGQPPGPELTGGPEPAADVQGGRSDKRKSNGMKDIEGVKKMLQAIPDLHERCKAKAHFRSLGYDV